MGTLSYNNEFTTNTSKELINYMNNPKDYLQYTIETPEGLNEPPILEICRIFEEGNTFINKELMTRYCVKGKPIKIKLGDKYIGNGFCLNSLTDDWSLVQEFREHALALNLLIEVCTAYIMGKYMPSRKSTSTEKA